VNLAPAGVRKEGAAYDLPIALALLAAAAQPPLPDLVGWCVLGELGLDGRVHAVRGTLPIAAAARTARLRGLIIEALLGGYGRPVDIMLTPANFSYMADIKGYAHDLAKAKALVKDADAVIENYSAEVLRKFGLDYAELARVNPSLVMVSMAAFGSTGPWKETRAYGSTLEQGSGLPSVAGRPDDPPMMNHLAFGDAVGGLNACSALLIALLHRKRTGEGQFIDLSQVQCMLPFTAAWAIEQSATGRVRPRAGNRHPLFVPHGIFASAGTDKWISIAATQGMCRCSRTADDRMRSNFS